jgi:hypothetical protein
VDHYKFDGNERHEAQVVPDNIDNGLPVAPDDSDDDEYGVAVDDWHVFYGVFLPWIACEPI